MWGQVVLFWIMELIYLVIKCLLIFIQIKQRQVITMRSAQNDDNLSNILRMFRSYHLDEQALLTKLQLTNVMNQQVKKKLGRDCNPQIIKEIWGQAQTNSRGESTMRTFAQILNDAINNLQSRLYRINSNEGGIPYFQKQLQAKNSVLTQLQNEYESGFLQNYQKINIQRKNKIILQDKIRELQLSQSDFQKDLQQLRTCIQAPPPPAKVAVIQQSQVVEHQIQPDFQASVSFERRPNPNLLTIFQITAAAILLQLLILTVRLSLLSISCYCLIIYWLFYGYFDRNFVTYLLGGLGVSVVFDVIYVLLQLLGSVGTTRPSGGKGYLVVLIIFLILELAIRVILIIKIYPLREPQQKEEYFQLFGKQIILRRRAGKPENFYGGQ